MSNSEPKNQDPRNEVNPRNQVSAYARVDGAKLGVLWIFSFALFVGNFHYPICGILWMATMVYTPFYVAILTKRYADNVCEGKISYFHAYLHSMLTVFHAALILAIVQWAYFQYLDHGFIIEQYLSALNDKEFAESFSRLGYSKDLIPQLSEQLRKMRPIDIAIQLLWSNMVAGIVMSLTTALFASVSRRIK